MKKIFFIIISSSIFLSSCNAVRDSAGVNRKQIDEYSVIENPPLVIPPNFNLLPPDQMNSKDIIDADSDLAKEILFGLEDIETKTNNNQSLINQILIETEANEVNDNIRNSINEEFANEKSTINDETTFNNEEEIDNAIQETEININKKENEKTAKEKKKKRFFFF
tara:strand:+ start:311 stop:808 length:498 start_codon:yes stop_codon:yes gene_type:complete